MQCRAQSPSRTPAVDSLDQFRDALFRATTEYGTSGREEIELYWKAEALAGLDVAK
jgi:hypothetical protein